MVNIVCIKLKLFNIFKLTFSCVSTAKSLLSKLSIFQRFHVHVKLVYMHVYYVKND